MDATTTAPPSPSPSPGSDPEDGHLDGSPHHVRRAVMVVTFAFALAAGYLGLQGCGRAPDRSPQAFCERLAVVRNVGTHLAAYDATALEGDLLGLEELRRVAPADIEPDVGAIATMVQTLAAAVAPAPGSDPEDRVKKVWAEHRTDIDKIGASARRVRDYAAAACGVDLDPTTTTGPGTTVAPTSTAPPTTAGKRAGASPVSTWASTSSAAAR